MRNLVGLAALGVALAAGAAGRAGQAQLAAPSAPPAAAPAPPVELSSEYLRDPKNVARGREVWVARCQFCHGKTAYPGKAPRLDPSRYTAEFVYDRVTNGFRGMPGWRHEFSEDDRKAVVAYVLSKEFSN